MKMKFFFIIFPLPLIIIFFFVGSLQIEARGQGAKESTEIPELNRDIISFVDKNMKKKVGRGECWDLAAEALNKAGSKWNGKLKFGRPLDLKTEKILPGDIIQFEGVKLKYEEENIRYREVMKHHTGIIYTVYGPKEFEMANQNTAQYGRKVGLSRVNLNNVISGKYLIYRPEK